MHRFFFPVVPSGNNVRWFHWDSIIFVHLQICWSQTDRILPDVTCLIYLFWFNISFWAILAGWWFQILFIFIPIWGNDPIWLTCFKWVESTNQPGFPGFFFKKCVCLVHVASSSAIPPVPQGWCHVQGGWSQSGTLSLDAVGRLGDVFRMEKLPSYVGIFRDHEIWIPIKQPGFHGKVRLFFFSLAHVCCFSSAFMIRMLPPVSGESSTGRLYISSKCIEFVYFFRKGFQGRHVQYTNRRVDSCQTQTRMTNSMPITNFWSRLQWL